MADILIVDDDDEIRCTLKEALESAGHTVRAASDGEAALRMYDERRAELIIMDLVMPDKDGIETIREVRRRNSPVQVIAISGESVSLKVSRLLGADYTLQKPFRHEAILALIERALERG